MPECVQAGGWWAVLIPEAFDNAHLLVGLVTVAGFRIAFGLSRAG